jgi:predicted transcriptional regulator
MGVKTGFKIIEGQRSSMDKILQLSVELATAHISMNPMSAEQVSPLIKNIYQTLKELEEAASLSPAPPAIVDDAAGDTPEDEKPSAKTAPVINLDVSDEAFEGLDPWLAARISRRLAAQLNRNSTLHPTVFPDHIICLEDGAKVKLLRAYVRKRFGLTFHEYLNKWSLPDDYPVAPPNLLEAKRSAAKTFGLGTTTRAHRGSKESQRAD